MFECANDKGERIFYNHQGFPIPCADWHCASQLEQQSLPGVGGRCTTLLNLGYEIPAFSGLGHRCEVVKENDLIGSRTVVFFYETGKTLAGFQRVASFKPYEKLMENFHIQVVGVCGDIPSFNASLLSRCNFLTQSMRLVFDEPPMSRISKAFGAWKQPEWSQDVHGARITSLSIILDEDRQVAWLGGSTAPISEGERCFAALRKLGWVTSDGRTLESENKGIPPPIPDFYGRALHPNWDGNYGAWKATQ